MKEMDGVVSGCPVKWSKKRREPGEIFQGDLFSFWTDYFLTLTADNRTVEV